MFCATTLELAGLGNLRGGDDLQNWENGDGVLKETESNKPRKKNVLLKTGKHKM